MPRRGWEPGIWCKGEDSVLDGKQGEVCVCVCVLDIDTAGVLRGKVGIFVVRGEPRF